MLKEDFLKKPGTLLKPLAPGNHCLAIKSFKNLPQKAVYRSYNLVLRGRDPLVQRLPHPLDKSNGGSGDENLRPFDLACEVRACEESKISRSSRVKKVTEQS